MAESAALPNWSKNTSLICKTTLDLPPSCLEFIPKPAEGAEASSHLRDHHHEYFVVGTYYLEKDESTETSLDPERHDCGDGDEPLIASKPQSKNGSLILFRYRAGALQIVQTFPHPSAIFDLHFLPDRPIFAIVSSAGDVAIFRVVEAHASESGTAKGPSIETIVTHKVFTDDISPTFFTWAPNSQNTIGITTSDGVYLVHFSTNYDSFQIMNNGEPVIKHSEYAWCCTFSSSGDRIYSGGDDNKLCVENLGSALSILDPEESIEPSGVYPKGLPGHEAGVTFILPIPLSSSDGQSQFLLTGSYDDRIRVYSIPSYPIRPRVITELHLGGGVWRLKFLDSPTSTDTGSDSAVQFIVLASCMHAGARILSIVGTKQDSEWSWEIKVLAEMSLHKSMNYASDVQPIFSPLEVGARGSRICVSSSFYDRLLCVWKWDPDEVA